MDEKPTTYNNKYYIEAEIQRRHDEKCRDLVHQKCTYLDGKLVRGFVSKIECRNCKAPRFDDGRRCTSCGSYQNRYLEMTEDVQ